MLPQKFVVRWCFLATCIFISFSFVWIVRKRVSPSRLQQQTANAVGGGSPLKSTRSAMIEKQLGRPLIVDPDMPYIGYIKPGEWRRYNLPEGTGVGRGSRGKQRNKFADKTKPNQGKSKGGKRHDEVDQNQLFFNTGLDNEVKANIVAEGNVGQLESIDEEQEEGEAGEEEEMGEEDYGGGDRMGDEDGWDGI